MNILLVYPETPPTFFSFKDALKFISKKSAVPPLGLLTVAAMLPEDWETRLIDMNVEPLADDRIRWADYVFLSGMSVQKNSFKQVVKRCNQLDVKVVAGGPMVTVDYREFQGVDHFLLNEAEVTLPLFLKDLKNGSPQRVYRSDAFPDMNLTPIPKWRLLKKKNYAEMSVQYSRGCPFNCEFCGISLLNGRRPRTRDTDRFLAELDSLYQEGWRGGIFIVDDNFIGNKHKLKTEVLPALAEWLESRRHPFTFTTEVSINLADDDRLIHLMIEAGFTSVFVGIETPITESLTECGKHQNTGRDIVASVKKLQRAGFSVSGGFIVGFDHDPRNIFEEQVKLIQNSGIVSAMVGLLNAPKGTRLYRRLKSENRLLDTITGDNMDGSINFLPKMDYKELIKGYKEVLDNIYSPGVYYERIKIFLKEYRPPKHKSTRLNANQVKGFLKSILKLGIMEKGKKYYWKLFFLALFRHPRKFPLAMTMAVYGFHFRKIVTAV